MDQREPDDRWGVSEDLPGRLSLPRWVLPGWVQLVLGSHTWGVIAFGVLNPRLLPVRFAAAPVEEIVKLAHCWCRDSRLMVSGFNGDSLASTCASEGSRSLMGGSTIVTWSLWVDLLADGKVLRCAVLIGICCTLHSIVHYGGKWGLLSIIVV